MEGASFFLVQFRVATRKEGFQVERTGNRTPTKMLPGGVTGNENRDGVGGVVRLIWGSFIWKG